MAVSIVFQEDLSLLKSYTQQYLKSLLFLSPQLPLAVNKYHLGAILYNPNCVPIKMYHVSDATLNHYPYQNLFTAVLPIIPIYTLLLFS